MVLMSLRVIDGYTALFAINKISCIKAEISDDSDQKTLVFLQCDDEPFRVKESLKEIKEKLEMASIEVEIV